MSGTLSMSGQIDNDFQSVPATRITPSEGVYVDGVWVSGEQLSTEYKVTIQPASLREIQYLIQGGERVGDVRRIYISDGDIEHITNVGDWVFLGQRWKTVQCDNRYWRDYCKILVSRYDDQ